MPALTRSELEGQADRYVDALLARDPRRLDLAPGARFTENGQEIALGDGLWGTATSEPAPRRAVYVADPVAGQVGFFGAVAEHGAPCLLGVRLRFGPDGLSEVEQLVCRPGHSLFSLFNPEGMGDDRPHFREPVAVASRPGRALLASVPTRYFDGIEANDGSDIPVRDQCVRFENGVQTVRRPTAEGGFGRGDRMQVAEQISSGLFRYMGAIRERRYPVMDEERGLVLAIALFDHPGKLTSVDVKGAGTIDLPDFAKRPTSALIMEVFKVVDGTIVAIEALLDFFPFGMHTGW